MPQERFIHLRQGQNNLLKAPQVHQNPQHRKVIHHHPIDPSSIKIYMHNANPPINWRAMIIRSTGRHNILSANQLTSLLFPRLFFCSRLFFCFRFFFYRWCRFFFFLLWFLQQFFWVNSQILISPFRNNIHPIRKFLI